MDTGASCARGDSWGGEDNVGTAWFPAPTADMEEAKAGMGHTAASVSQSSPGLALSERL